MSYLPPRHGANRSKVPLVNVTVTLVKLFGVDGSLVFITQFFTMVISSFAADIVLDKDPWLNETTACTFPFGPSSKKQNMERKSDTVDEAAFDVKDSKIPEMKRDQFLGQYGNFARGNLTVVTDDLLDTLVINFDIYSCVVRKTTGDVQICIGLDPYWFLILYEVRFDNENNPSQFVDITFTLGENPVRFKRDLLLVDAAGPRDHWPQCDSV